MIRRTSHFNRASHCNRLGRSNRPHRCWRLSHCHPRRAVAAQLAGVAVLSSLLAFQPGCEDTQPKLKLRDRPAQALDRLETAEQLPGQERIFGIEVPRGMKVASRFGDVIMLTGRVDRNAVANHFRQHVLTQHVEMAEGRTVFPRVHVKGDRSRRVYRIEIAQTRNLTSVSMRDVTQPPATHGLSEGERWDQAGRNPDGSQKDRLRAL